MKGEAVLRVGPWRRMGKYVGRDVWLASGKRTTELQHRAIVAEREGRALRADEHVHHQDEVKSNNAPENLELLTHAEHTRRHFGTGRTMLDLVCESCGEVFRVDVRRRNAKTCSRACAGKRSGLRSAAARRERHGTAQPPCPWRPALDQVLEGDVDGCVETLADVAKGVA